MKQFKVSNTNSMYPTMKENDLVVIKKMANYIVGDILAYKNKNKQIGAHRLINIEEGYYLTKGDNNYKSEKTLKNKVVGKVIFINKQAIKTKLSDKIITQASYFQTKIGCETFERNKILRIMFKIITNPILYLKNIKQIILS